MWTAKDIPNQKDKTIIVTGGNTGIGFETALALYRAGAKVIIACRDKEKADQAIKEMKNRKGNGSLEVSILDLSSLDSVKQFADTFMQQHQGLDLLINNAGVATPPESKTNEGFEMQFGVNFLGHFYLTGLLYPLLLKTENSRIITLSSNGYQTAVIDFENLKAEKDYDALREYRQSKLANLIFSIELDRRIKAKGHQVLSIAAQPGANNTELTRHLSAEAIAIGKERLGTFMEPWQGALSVLYAAVSEQASGGNMYEPEESGLRGYPTLANIQENAMDKKVAQKLWGLAEKITGLEFLA
ncbi:NAD(P)-dependent dehydrogenase (short-subunit alcohol dehydrogenase family) [Pedobacter sp. UYP30]|uniref:oxidoreductase n=1 Tax=Pedobacter sp. UYP30 TaxID=1756400 RepID=UPI003399CE31